MTIFGLPPPGGGVRSTVTSQCLLEKKIQLAYSGEGGFFFIQIQCKIYFVKQILIKMKFWRRILRINPFLGKLWQKIHENCIFVHNLSKFAPHPPTKKWFSIILLKKATLIRKILINFSIILSIFASKMEFLWTFAPQNRFSIILIKKRPIPSVKINFYDHFLIICFKNRYFIKICPPPNRFRWFWKKKGPPHPKKLIFTTILSKFASKIDFWSKFW